MLRHLGRFFSYSSPLFNRRLRSLFFVFIVACSVGHSQSAQAWTQPATLNINDAVEARTLNEIQTFIENLEDSALFCNGALIETVWVSFPIAAGQQITAAHINELRAATRNFFTTRCYPVIAGNSVFGAPVAIGTVVSVQNVLDIRTALTYVEGVACVNSCAAAACADGTINAGEQCDDGNTSNGDGCNNACQCEYTWVDSGGCGTPPCNAVQKPQSGTSLSAQCAATSQCISCLCGNGAPDAGEECDDSNSANGDGCSAACVCEYTAWVNSACSPAGGCPAGQMQQTRTSLSASCTNVSQCVADASCGSCTAVGGACGAPADCCTGSTCVSSVCTSCGAINSACSAESDCCSGSCCDATDPLNVWGDRCPVIGLCTGVHYCGDGICTDDTYQHERYGQVNACCYDCADCPGGMACSNTTFVCVNQCNDSVQNHGETGVDCGGGGCGACSTETCSDGIQNQDEIGIDCGGVCGVNNAAGACGPFGYCVNNPPIICACDCEASCRAISGGALGCCGAAGTCGSTWFQTSGYDYCDNLTFDCA